MTPVDSETFGGMKDGGDPWTDYSEADRLNPPEYVNANPFDFGPVLNTENSENHFFIPSTAIQHFPDMQHSVHDLEISDDDYCGSDFYSAAEEMDADEKDGDQWHRLVSSTHPDSSRPTPKPDTPRRFNSMTLSEQSPGLSTSLVRSVCVVSS
ncbi:hypothetical protein BYT27DRAFT_7262688 [Phlegmacium glaucopus]|nr:hypothetical protein BYT27DRAFT_7262688 [Phlegmacium glaucopus]